MKSDKSKSKVKWGMHPNSLASLRPNRGGEIRNPKGRPRKIRVQREQTLSPKEQVFVAKIVPRLMKNEFMTQSASAQEAGYAAPGPSGSSLMKRPHVLRAIDEKLTAELSAVDAETHALLEQLASISFFDPRKMFNEDGTAKQINELDEKTASAISGIEVESLFEGKGSDRERNGTLRKWKVADKLSAIRMFMEFKKLLGTQRVEITGKNGAPFSPPIIHVNFVSVGPGNST